MLDLLLSHLNLPVKTLALATVVVFVAGIIRGFAGFGLSAFIMASLATFIPPVALIPICFQLEAISSLIMLRGGLSHGNRRLVLGLATGYTIGLPLGLTATSILPVEVSRLIALMLILLLATLQLLRASPGSLRWPGIVVVIGILAGVATGLASLGGMVVALYAMTLTMQTREIRGSLVLFLLISMFVTGFWLSTIGILDTLALKRALILAPTTVLGVFVGIWLFRPSLEHIYKRFCLFLLISIAGLGLIRLMAGQT